MAKVLIVEDDQTINSAYRQILTKEGHDVEIAFNGEEALSVVEKFRPDIILLDILMPKVNGLEFLEQYDVLHKHKDTIVVILSNLGMDEEIRRAMELGAYKYIIKAHMGPSELAVLVNHLMNKDLQKKTKKPKKS
jgi:PleD family two-component response regulator